MLALYFLLNLLKKFSFRIKIQLKLLICNIDLYNKEDNTIKSFEETQND